jgi:hypothetical protein
MSAAGSEQPRIRENVRRTVGRRALRELRGIVDEEQRADAANARFLRGLLKYGIIIMLAASLALAHWLGVY